MRFMSFSKNNQRGLAVEVNSEWKGLLQSDASWPGDLDEIVRSGGFDAAFNALKEGSSIDADAVTCELPFRKADKFLCVGLNYSDHAAEADMDLPPYPTAFVRFNSNLVADGGKLIRPKVSDAFDYEGELVAVIGKSGRGIKLEDALDHVAGYTIFNDGSIRDYQLQTAQWTVGKNFDDTGALGPVFVTADALPAGAKGLRLQTRLNGEVLQDANTDQLIFSVADLVSKLSVGMTLQPGDMIATGTPSGVGFARDPQILMKPGDVCEVEIDQIGVLRNTVDAQA